MKIVQMNIKIVQMDKKNSSNEHKNSSNINFVHGSHKYHIDIIDDVAAGPGRLACPSRSARPRNCPIIPNSTLK